MKDTAEKEFKKFQAEFQTLVSIGFTDKCFEYARAELQKKLGVK